MTSNEFMRDVLQRIATDPTLSKDLSFADAQRAMRIILDGDADEVQAGIFLIALRMKRETDEELMGILDAINAGVTPQLVAVDEMVTLVDPYDGYLRGTPAAPFLPAGLAACGLKVLTHGVQSMGPKFGATHGAVLKAAGVQLPVDRIAAAQALENENRGWAYLSQAQLAPELAALSDLRTRIVKRPCLTTIEVAVDDQVRDRFVQSVFGAGLSERHLKDSFSSPLANGGFGDIKLRSELFLRFVAPGVHAFKVAFQSIGIADPHHAELLVR